MDEKKGKLVVRRVTEQGLVPIKAKPTPSLADLRFAGLGGAQTPERAPAPIRLEEFPKAIATLKAQGFQSQAEVWPAEFRGMLDALEAIAIPILESLHLQKLRWAMTRFIWLYLADRVWQLAQVASEDEVKAIDYWKVELGAWAKHGLAEYGRSAGADSEWRSPSVWLWDNFEWVAAVEQRTRELGLTFTEGVQVFALADAALGKWLHRRGLPWMSAKEGRVSLDAYQNEIAKPAFDHALAVAFGDRATPTGRIERFKRSLDAQLRSRVRGYRSQRRAEQKARQQFEALGGEDGGSFEAYLQADYPEASYRALKEAKPKAAETYLRLKAVMSKLPAHLGVRERKTRAYRLLARRGPAKVPALRKRVADALDFLRHTPRRGGQK